MVDAGKRIALAAIPNGGCTESGDAVIFDLKAKDGRLFEFSCPHEAVSQIVETLLGFATFAREKRGGIDLHDEPLGLHTTAARKLTSAAVDISPDGKLVILKLQCGPVLRTSMAMPPHSAKQISTSLAEAQLKCLEIVAPQKRPAN